MAKITRVLQKLFGSASGANQIGKFGSLAAGSPAYTTDPAMIQALGNFLTGWYGAVVGGANAPAIEDRNALDFLWSRQIAYILQAGVAEYDATTTYYIGSLVNDGFGNTYKSLTDNNTGNALTSTANWQVTRTGQYTKIIGSTGYATIAAASITAGDSVLVTDDLTVAAAQTISADDVRMDFMPGKRLISTQTTGTILTVSGNRFRSSNLSIKATGALAAAGKLLDLSGADSIVSALYCELSNAGIALTNVMAFSGSRCDVNGSIVATSGTYTNPYSGSDNNTANIRGA